MKRLLSILLILLFFSDAAAPPAVFAFIKSKAERDARRSIERGVPENQLFKLTEGSADQSKAQWIKPEKEFKLRGSFYDVVRCEIKNGVKTYLCLNDKKEKALFKKFGSIINGSFSNALTKNKLAKLALKKLVGYRVFGMFALQTWRNRSLQTLATVEELIEISLSPPVPPPRSY